MHLALAIAVVCASLVGTLPVHAEKRVALVIGNNRYVNLSEREQLQKAVSDAQAVGRALRQIEFDEVIAGENLGRQAFVDKLDELAGKLSPGDTAFFFFSGHGVVLDGVNYVLPADVPDVAARQITRLKGAAVAEDYIESELLRSGARVAVVVLDACRNSPFARSGTKGVGWEKGLQPHDPPSGVFTLYAAGRNEAALDRLGDGDPNPNGVFTRALLPALTRPSLDLTGIAIEVKEKVTRLAGSVRHEQHPAYYDRTASGRIYLASLPPANSGGGTVAPPPGPTVDEAIWAYLEDSKDPEKIARFIEDFPLSPRRRDAERLRATLLAAVTPVIRPQPDDPCAGPVTVSFPSRCAAPLIVAQERELKPKDSFKECAECPEMVVVPAGSFTMGAASNEKDRDKDEGPQHQVSFSQPFAVGKFAVTFEEWAACVADGGCGGYRPNDQGWGRGRLPVINVSWDDAKAYVGWLSRKTGKTYRLPSESEREYVTRAGTTTPFWWGSAIATTQANYDGNYTYGGPKGEYRQRTMPVDSFQPNPWGLYQVHGNVWEWTEDCYHESYIGAPNNSSAWTAGNCSRRVVRGGAWFINPGSLRAAIRLGVAAVFRSDVVGFRVARTLTP
jgi:formylglycine-generating enzyme required for sulfatase activity